VLSVTLLAYPPFAGLMIVAPQFIEVVYGKQWQPAVLPFQILCVAGMLKVLNEYADSALQAAGWVWSEVWCQTAYLILTIGGVAILSRYGLVGAAVAVLIATIIMFGLLLRLMRQATMLSWRDMLEPQAPAVLCAAGILALVALTRMFLHNSVGGLSDGLVLLTEVAVCAPFYLAFLRFSRFPEVRSLLRETLSDFAPGLAKTVKPLG
jgi:PST family polysaccharide transporter